MNVKNQYSILINSKKLTHDYANIHGLNFAKIYLTITSVINIVLLQFEPYYSEAFKIFLNYIWFIGVNIGLTTSGFLIGFDSYTSQKIYWRQWIQKHKIFYKSYYLYASIVIITGWISYGIMQLTNSNIDYLISPKEDPYNFLSKYNYGWTDNINNWYGFLALYTLIPTQNFFTMGTIFVTTLFFFNLVAPYVYNFINRMNFSTCTTFITFLLIIAIFLSTWNNIFTINQNWSNKIWWNKYVNIFLWWYLIVFLFITGFYIRKYTKIIPFKIALILFSSFAITFSTIETILNFYFHKFNFFYIGAQITSIPILLLSYLIINIFSGYQINKKNIKILKKIIDFNSYSQNYISDQFILACLWSRIVYGILVLNIILGYNTQLINNHMISVTNSGINKEIWGWTLIPCAVIIIVLIYGITWLKQILFNKLDIFILNKKKSFLN